MYGESFLSMAHREWHYVNGANAVCPLDCGVGEGLYDEDEQEANAELD